MGASLRSVYAFVARFLTNLVFALPDAEDEGHEDFGDLGTGGSQLPLCHPENPRFALFHRHIRIEIRHPRPLAGKYLAELALDR